MKKEIHIKKYHRKKHGRACHGGEVGAHPRGSGNVKSGRAMIGRCAECGKPMEAKESMPPWESPTCDKCTWTKSGRAGLTPFRRQEAMKKIKETTGTYHDMMKDEALEKLKAKSGRLAPFEEIDPLKDRYMVEGKTRQLGEGEAKLLRHKGKTVKRLGYKESVRKVF